MPFDTRQPLSIQSARTINVGRGSGGGGSPSPEPGNALFFDDFESYTDGQDLTALSDSPPTNTYSAGNTFIGGVL